MSQIFTLVSVHQEKDNVNPQGFCWNAQERGHGSLTVIVTTFTKLIVTDECTFFAGASLKSTVGF